MIIDDELARLYADRFAQPIMSGRTVRRSRISEYRKVGLIDQSISDRDAEKQIAGKTSEGIEKWLNKLRSILLAANQDIPKIVNQVPILEVWSYSQYTSIKKLDSDTPCIFVDSGLLSFLWRMNKAYVYGQESGEFSRRLLAAMTIAHHAAQICPPDWGGGRHDVEHLFPAPKTPPHTIELYNALMGLIIQHETFVLAHEIAHFMLGHLDGYDSQPKDNNQLPISAMQFIKGNVTHFAWNEFEADKLALRFCVNAFGESDAYHTEGTLITILQLMRYIMWLEVALREGTQTQEDFLWAARYFVLRREIEEFAPGMRTAVLEYLDWFEDEMDSGMLSGVNIYIDILKNPPKSKR